MVFFKPFFQYTRMRNHAHFPTERLVGCSASKDGCERMIICDELERTGKEAGRVILRQYPGIRPWPPYMGDSCEHTEE